MAHPANSSEAAAHLMRPLRVASLLIAFFCCSLLSLFEESPAYDSSVFASPTLIVFATGAAQSHGLRVEAEVQAEGRRKGSIRSINSNWELSSSNRILVPPAKEGGSGQGGDENGGHSAPVDGGALPMPASSSSLSAVSHRPPPPPPAPSSASARAGEEEDEEEEKEGGSWDYSDDSDSFETNELLRWSTVSIPTAITLPPNRKITTLWVGTTIILYTAGDGSCYSIAGLGSGGGSPRSDDPAPTPTFGTRCAVWPFPTSVAASNGTSYISLVHDALPIAIGVTAATAYGGQETFAVSDVTQPTLQFSQTPFKTVAPHRRHGMLVSRTVMVPDEANPKNLISVRQLLLIGGTSHLIEAFCTGNCPPDELTSHPSSSSSTNPPSSIGSSKSSHGGGGRRKGENDGHATDGFKSPPFASPPSRERPYETPKRAFARMMAYSRRHEAREAREKARAKLAEEVRRSGASGGQNGTADAGITPAHATRVRAAATAAAEEAARRDEREASIDAADFSGWGWRWFTGRWPGLDGDPQAPVDFPLICAGYATSIANGTIYISGGFVCDTLAPSTSVYGLDISPNGTTTRMWRVAPWLPRTARTDHLTTVTSFFGIATFDTYLIAGLSDMCGILVLYSLLQNKSSIIGNADGKNPHAVASGAQVLSHVEEAPALSNCVGPQHFVHSSGRVVLLSSMDAGDTSATGFISFGTLIPLSLMYVTSFTFDSFGNNGGGGGRDGFSYDDYVDASSGALTGTPLSYVSSEDAARELAQYFDDSEGDSSVFSALHDDAGDAGRRDGNSDDAEEMQGEGGTDIDESSFGVSNTILRRVPYRPNSGLIITLASASIHTDVALFATKDCHGRLPFVHAFRKSFNKTDSTAAFTLTIDHRGLKRSFAQMKKYGGRMFPRTDDIAPPIATYGSSYAYFSGYGFLCASAGGCPTDCPIISPRKYDYTEPAAQFLLVKDPNVCSVGFRPLTEAERTWPHGNGDGRSYFYCNRTAVEHAPPGQFPWPAPGESVLPDGSLPLSEQTRKYKSSSGGGGHPMMPPKGQFFLGAAEDDDPPAPPTSEVMTYFHAVADSAIIFEPPPTYLTRTVTASLAGPAPTAPTTASPNPSDDEEAFKRRYPYLYFFFGTSLPLPIAMFLFVVMCVGLFCVAVLVTCCCCWYFAVGCFRADDDGDSDSEVCKYADEDDFDDGEHDEYEENGGVGVSGPLQQPSPSTVALLGVLNTENSEQGQVGGEERPPYAADGDEGEFYSQTPVTSKSRMWISSLFSSLPVKTTHARHHRSTASRRRRDPAGEGGGGGWLSAWLRGRSDRSVDSSPNSPFFYDRCDTSSTAANNAANCDSLFTSERSLAARSMAEGGVGGREPSSPSPPRPLRGPADDDDESSFVNVSHGRFRPNLHGDNLEYIDDGDDGDGENGYNPQRDASPSHEPGNTPLLMSAVGSYATAASILSPSVDGFGGGVGGGNSSRAAGSRLSGFSALGGGGGSSLIGPMAAAATASAAVGGGGRALPSARGGSRLSHVSSFAGAYSDNRSNSLGPLGFVPTAAINTAASAAASQCAVIGDSTTGTAGPSHRPAALSSAAAAPTASASADTGGRLSNLSLRSRPPSSLITANRGGDGSRGDGAFFAAVGDREDHQNPSSSAIVAGSVSKSDGARSLPSSQRSATAVSMPSFSSPSQQRAAGTGGGAATVGEAPDMGKKRSSGNQKGSRKRRRKPLLEALRSIPVLGLVLGGPSVGIGIGMALPPDSSVTAPFLSSGGAHQLAYDSDSDDGGSSFYSSSSSVGPNPKPKATATAVGSRGGVSHHRQRGGGFLSSIVATVFGSGSGGGDGDGPSRRRGASARAAAGEGRRREADGRGGWLRDGSDGDVANAYSDGTNEDAQSLATRHSHAASNGRKAQQRRGGRNGSSRRGGMMTADANGGGGGGRGQPARMIHSQRREGADSPRRSRGGSGPQASTRNESSGRSKNSGEGSQAAGKAASTRGTSTRGRGASSRSSRGGGGGASDTFSFATNGESAREDSNATGVDGSNSKRRAGSNKSGALLRAPAQLPTSIRSHGSHRGGDGYANINNSNTTNDFSSVKNGNSNSSHRGAVRSLVVPPANGGASFAATSASNGSSSVRSRQPQSARSRMSHHSTYVAGKPNSTSPALQPSYGLSGRSRNRSGRSNESVPSPPMGATSRDGSGYAGRSLPRLPSPSAARHSSPSTTLSSAPASSRRQQNHHTNNTKSTQQPHHPKRDGGNGSNPSASAATAAAAAGKRPATVVVVRSRWVRRRRGLQGGGGDNDSPSAAHHYDQHDTDDGSALGASSTGIGGTATHRRHHRRGGRRAIDVGANRAGPVVATAPANLPLPPQLDWPTGQQHPPKGEATTIAAAGGASSQAVDTNPATSPANGSFAFASGSTKYTLDRLLGRGGYGMVFLGRRCADGTPVAIKYVKCRDDAELDAALTEFEILHSLRHPHIVPIWDMFLNSQGGAGGGGGGGGAGGITSGHHPLLAPPTSPPPPGAEAAAIAAAGRRPRRRRRKKGIGEDEGAAPSPQPSGAAASAISAPPPQQQQRQPQPPPPPSGPSKEMLELREIQRAAGRSSSSSYVSSSDIEDYYFYTGLHGQRPGGAAVGVAGGVANNSNSIEGLAAAPIPHGGSFSVLDPSTSESGGGLGTAGGSRGSLGAVVGSTRRRERMLLSGKDFPEYTSIYLHSSSQPAAVAVGVAVADATTATPTNAAINVAGGVPTTASASPTCIFEGSSKAQRESPALTTTATATATATAAASASASPTALPLSNPLVQMYSSDDEDNMNLIDDGDGAAGAYLCTQSPSANTGQGKSAVTSTNGGDPSSRSLANASSGPDHLGGPTGLCLTPPSRPFADPHPSLPTARRQRTVVFVDGAAEEEGEGAPRPLSATPAGEVEEEEDVFEEEPYDDDDDEDYDYNDYFEGEEEEYEDEDGYGYYEEEEGEEEEDSRMHGEFSGAYDASDSAFGEDDDVHDDYDDDEYDSDAFSYFEEFYEEEVPEEEEGEEEEEEREGWGEAAVGEKASKGAFGAADVDNGDVNTNAEATVVRIDAVVATDFDGLGGGVVSRTDSLGATGHFPSAPQPSLLTTAGTLTTTTTTTFGSHAPSFAASAGLGGSDVLRQHYAHMRGQAYVHSAAEEKSLGREEGVGEQRGGSPAAGGGVCDSNHSLSPALPPPPPPSTAGDCDAVGAHTPHSGTLVAPPASLCSASFAASASLAVTVSDLDKRRRGASIGGSQPQQQQRQYSGVIAAGTRVDVDFGLDCGGGGCHAYPPVSSSSLLNAARPPMSSPSPATSHSARTTAAGTPAPTAPPPSVATHYAEAFASTAGSSLTSAPTTAYALAIAGGVPFATGSSSASASAKAFFAGASTPSQAAAAAVSSAGGRHQLHMSAHDSRHQRPNSSSNGGATADDGDGDGDGDGPLGGDAVMLVGVGMGCPLSYASSGSTPFGTNGGGGDRGSSCSIGDEEVDGESRRSDYLLGAGSGFGFGAGGGGFTTPNMFRSPAPEAGGSTVKNAARGGTSAHGDGPSAHFHFNGGGSSEIRRTASSCPSASKANNNSIDVDDVDGTVTRRDSNSNSAGADDGGAPYRHAYISLRVPSSPSHRVAAAPLVAGGAAYDGYLPISPPPSSASRGATSANSAAREGGAPLGGADSTAAAFSLARQQHQQRREALRRRFAELEGEGGEGDGGRSPAAPPFLPPTATAAGSGGAFLGNNGSMCSSSGAFFVVSHQNHNGVGIGNGKAPNGKLGLGGGDDGGGGDHSGDSLSGTLNSAFAYSSNTLCARRVNSDADDDGNSGSGSGESDTNERHRRHLRRSHSGTAAAEAAETTGQRSDADTVTPTNVTPGSSVNALYEGVGGRGGDDGAVIVGNGNGTERSCSVGSFATITAASASVSSTSVVAISAAMRRHALPPSVVNNIQQRSTSAPNAMMGFGGGVAASASNDSLASFPAAFAPNPLITTTRASSGGGTDEGECEKRQQQAEGSSHQPPLLQPIPFRPRPRDRHLPMPTVSSRSAATPIDEQQQQQQPSHLAYMYEQYTSAGGVGGVSAGAAAGAHTIHHFSPSSSPFMATPDATTKSPSTTTAAAAALRVGGTVGRVPSSSRQEERQRQRALMSQMDREAAAESTIMATAAAAGAAGETEATATFSSESAYAAGPSSGSGEPATIIAATASHRPRRGGAAGGTSPTAASAADGSHYHHAKRNQHHTDAPTPTSRDKEKTLAGGHRSAAATPLQQQQQQQRAQSGGSRGAVGGGGGGGLTAEALAQLNAQHAKERRSTKERERRLRREREREAEAAETSAAAAVGVGSNGRAAAAEGGDKGRLIQKTPSSVPRTSHDAQAGVSAAVAQHANTAAASAPPNDASPQAAALVLAAPSAAVAAPSAPPARGGFRYVAITTRYLPEGDLKHFIQRRIAETGRGGGSGRMAPRRLHPSYGGGGGGGYGPFPHHHHQQQTQQQNQQQQFLFNPYVERLSEAHIVSLSAQIATALLYLHTRRPHRIVHRDLKPENILLDGGANVAVLTDFGLAHDSSRTMGTQAGSLPYVAPEAWCGRYTEKVDVWAMGCVIYGLCTMRVSSSDVLLMFDAVDDPDFADLITADLCGSGVGGCGYSPELAGLVCAMLTKSAHHRISAAEALIWLKGMATVRGYSLDYVSQMPSEEALREALLSTPVSQDRTTRSRVAAFSDAATLAAMRAEYRRAEAAKRSGGLGHGRWL